MIGKALRRAATSTKLLIVAALLFSVGLVGGTFANFTAEDDTSTASYAGGWVSPPTSPSVTVSGYGGVIHWTHGTTTALLNQSIFGDDQSTTNSCAATYSTTLVTTLTNTIATYTDAESSSVNGHYYCYSLRSTYDNWTSATTTVGPTLVGLVPKTVVFTNHATSGSAANTDTIAITFNQNVADTTAPGVEVCTGGTIRLGSTSCTTGTPTIGTIAGLTTGGTSRAFGSSTIAGSGGTTLTITLAGGTGTTTVSGTGTFTASGTAVKSSTGAATECTLSTCKPTSTGSF